MSRTQENALLSDEAIIELYFARNEKAIAETERKYRDYLFKTANNILLNEADSEECINDTYLKVWNAIPPTRPKIFRAFLAKITRNIAFDKCRSESRKKRSSNNKTLSFDELEGFVSSNSTPETELESKAITETVNRYLREANDKKLYIFISRYFFAISISDIAQKLNCSESSVNKTIAEIKKELRQRFESEGLDI